MLPFLTALTFTLQFEGGLIEHPHDPGGLTNYGISQRAYPDEDIRGLTRERVEQIYRQDYWEKIRGDDISPALAFVLFDYAVNSGVSRAVKDLQKAVHAPEDGIIGPQTLHALSFYSVPTIVTKLLQARAAHFAALASRPTQKVFLRGWLNRLVANAVQAGIRWRE